MSLTRCHKCMKLFDDKYEVCPHCGHIQTEEVKEVYHLKPGTVLAGKYKLGVVIGYGGFGTVYKAWDCNLNQIVAIKEYYPTAFLYRAPGDKQAAVYDKKNRELFATGKEEFLEEARNVARFNQHPNIVHVYDFFEENGTAYFVMEFLDGDSLKAPISAARKAGGGMDCKVAVAITLAVLNALKAIHEAGIIHRDIKPGNIFLLRDGTVKVFDLGAARFSDDENEKTRTIIITPGYAPPEQYQRKSKQGAYTDIYAVGALLYEMLTGIKLAESIERKTEDTAKAPHEVNSAIPVTVSNAVMRAIAIQPKIRFQNVEDFAHALTAKKEVRSAKEEIKHRKRKRNFKITLLTLCMLCIGLICFEQYDSAKKEAVLNETELQLWVYCNDRGEEATQKQYQEMISEFIDAYPQVSITIDVIPETEYAEKLRQSLAAGKGPDLFDSTFLSTEDYEWLEPLDKFFDYENFEASQYYLLDRYREFFPSEKQLPLSVDIPVRYTNLLNAGLKDGDDYEDYIAGQANYIGYLSEYENVQNDMAGIYRIDTSFPEDRVGIFNNLWSVNVNTTQEKKVAAIRLLYYLLSDKAQDILTVQNSGGLPLNKNVLDVYVAINDDFSYVPAILDTLPAKGE